MFEYNAKVVRVVDGDTILLDVDLGFYCYVRMSCRLAGLNSIELSKPGGKEARAHLLTLVPVGSSVVVKSVKHDKYAGRFDGIMVTVAGIEVNAQMISDGFALPWDGTGKPPVPAQHRKEWDQYPRSQD